MNKLVCIGGFGYNFSKYLEKHNPKNVDIALYREDGLLSDTAQNINSLEDAKAYIEKDTQRLFVLAGFGKKIGAKIAPAIAELSKKLNIDTIGIATIPFVCEGEERRNKAIKEVEKLKENTDVLILLDNEKLLNQYEHLKFSAFFEKADEVLWNIITKISNGETNILEIIESDDFSFLEIVR